MEAVLIWVLLIAGAAFVWLVVAFTLALAVGKAIRIAEENPDHPPIKEK